MQATVYQSGEDVALETQCRGLLIAFGISLVAWICYDYTFAISAPFKFGMIFGLLNLLLLKKIYRDYKVLGYTADKICVSNGNGTAEWRTHSSLRNRAIIAGLVLTTLITLVIGCITTVVYWVFI